MLVPREASRGEHIDDHQAEIAAELSGSAIAITRRVEELELSDLLEATGRTIARVQQPPDFQLRQQRALLTAQQELTLPVNAKLG